MTPTGETGDGVGILLQISHRFFSQVARDAGIALGEERDYGVGMFFFPQDVLKRNQAMKMLEIITEKEGMEFLGWRKVPVAPDILGQKAARLYALHHAVLYQTSGKCGART